MKQHLTKHLGLQGVTGKFEGATEAQLVESETRLKLTFPEGYRQFLREFGPSLFTEDVVFTPIIPSPWAVDGNECFDVFYGISSDPGFDLCQANTRLKADLPNGTIAIGHDSGSNLVLLSAENNQVQFFDKETARTFLVAANFDDFLRSFHRRS